MVTLIPRHPYKRRRWLISTARSLTQFGFVTLIAYVAARQ